MAPCHFWVSLMGDHSEITDTNSFEGKNGPRGDNWDAQDVANPLFKRPKDGPNGWWFHGKVDEPPVDGEFVELVAGGHLNTEISCVRHFSTWGNTMHAPYGEQKMACGSHGMRHTQDAQDAKQLTDVKGCAIAIGYESDPRKLKPSEMVVISVDYQCPWFKAARFQIPAGLPPCPPGGCLCTWNWIHSAFGGQAEMMQTGFRCKVVGNTGTKALPRNPRVAQKCPYDRNNCTTGARTPFVWFQAEGNNIHQDFIDPPYYNWEYGFKNGAQDDIFTVDKDRYINTKWAPIPWHTLDHPVPKVTPATKANVPPVQPTLRVTPAPFDFKPGVSPPPNGPATRTWTGEQAQRTAGKKQRSYDSASNAD